MNKARKDTPAMPLDAAVASGCTGVDINDDHLAAWRLDPYGNPVGEPADSSTTHPRSVSRKG
jgi:hypothetical protein